MKLHDRITNEVAPKATEAQTLLKGVLDLTTKSLSVDPCKNKQTLLSTDLSDRVGMNDICGGFFEDVYIKPDILGKVSNAISGKEIKLTEPLSFMEADIINFFRSNDSKSKIYLVKDFAGKGKSTTLKYIAYYINEVEPEIAQSYLPIYISLRAFETKIFQQQTSDELDSLLCEEIKKSNFKLAKDYFFSDCSNILTWINDSYPSYFQGRFTSKDIQSASESPEEFIANIARSDPKETIDFIIAILCHYSLYERPIALLIDDADNFSIDIQRSVLDFSTRKIAQGFRALVALRESTWISLKKTISDQEYQLSPRNDWTLSQLKNLLLTRLDIAKSEMTQLHAGQLTGGGSEREIINAFVDILRENQTCDYIIKTANFNLHRIMRLLSSLADSWHFDDKFLLREQLLHHTTEDSVGVPLWSIYNLIFGNEKGSFASSDASANAGLINCFCTANENYASHTFFIRLHFLSRLKDCTDEKSFVSIKDLETEYRLFFGKQLQFTDVFQRAIFKLIQAGLVATESYRRYQDIHEIKAHLTDDSLHITVSGSYYLNSVINKVDYLSFMKDDIDWPEETNLKPMQPVSVGMKRWIKIKDTLRALERLMEIEFDMLRGILDNMTEIGDEKIAISYVEKFSAIYLKKGANKTPFFTKYILLSYKNYLEWSWKGYENQFKPELKSINRLLERNSNIIESFS